MTTMTTTTSLKSIYVYMCIYIDDKYLTTFGVVQDLQVLYTIQRILVKGSQVNEVKAISLLHRVFHLQNGHMHFVVFTSGNEK